MPGGLGPRGNPLTEWPPFPPHPCISARYGRCTGLFIFDFFFFVALTKQCTGPRISKTQTHSIEHGLARLEIMLHCIHSSISTYGATIKNDCAVALPAQAQVPPRFDCWARLGKPTSQRAVPGFGDMGLSLPLLPFPPPSGPRPKILLLLPVFG